MKKRTVNAGWRKLRRFAWAVGMFLMAAVVLFALVYVAAAVGDSSSARQGSPIHPEFPLLDERGRSVLEEGTPISTMQTCGACHDTEFIVEHSFHVDVGLSDFGQPGSVEGGRPWDRSPGLFGEWSPLTYRYLTAEGDERFDLGTPEWIWTIGQRHVGGGPAEFSRDGTTRLDDLQVQVQDPETAVLDPETGEVQAWDWSASGVVEMNCFLCHVPEPANEARVRALQAGDFRWANSATLMNTGLLARTEDGYRWSQDAFTESGEPRKGVLNLQDPESTNCGLCHGLVEDTLEEPLVYFGCQPEIIRTVTTGQIISPERLANTGLNLEDKENLTRSWDVHAERLLDCTDCHYSLNNPVYYQESEASQPEHLRFDPRRVELGEYLYQPLHEFARGQSAQGDLAPELRNTMRRCDSCHNIEATHDWLPHKERHVEALTCESCHVPYVYSTALQQYDWTVIDTQSQAATVCRGIDSEPGPDSVIEGYQPVLLERVESGGGTRLAPFNLLSSWYWVYGDPPRPVRMIDLEAAWLAGGDYAPEVLEVFDADGDRELAPTELRIDSPRKESIIAERLTALGLENPRIVGETQPYSINHTIAESDWAVRDCTDCHGAESRVTRPLELASYVPGGVEPELRTGSNVQFAGSVSTDASGALVYRPATEDSGRYVVGHDAVIWVDRLGALVLLGVLAAVGAHGGLRLYRAPRAGHGQAAATERVYMYGVYERLWHWLQTAAILGLLATGLAIHKPDAFGFLSFRYAVLVHNVLAAIVVLNAALALFYHLASGEIRQFLPRPVGFFDQAVAQGRFYLRGIFRGEPHPFEKSPHRKLNPLQQVTYLAILNVLLPLQILTGIAMWAAGRWPEVAAGIGGLGFLAPFHTLIAWLFAAFIVAHVYLTTTGHEPLSGVKAMVVGWEEVESGEPDGQGGQHDRNDS
ncbi:MAG: cytochrome b/b6 domain-containing protein [Anaerolineales bacterium]|nr:cytochrome b/b6 domain-containing protein [Anaerolineales bacterium]